MPHSSLNKSDGIITIEISYDDGTVARWVLDHPSDIRIEQVEHVLGTPDTMLC